MALQTKKLSHYDDLESSSIDSTTKIVVLTGSVKTNKNLPLSNFIEDSLTSDNPLKPLSAKQGKALKAIVDSIGTTSDKVLLINTDTFIPPTIASETDFQITPGSYGVTFSEYPIEGLEDLDFNLEISYLSNGKDILHTLTNNEGREFTRALYKNGLTTYSSTSFIESGIVDLSELYGQRDVLISTSTFIPATATGYQITPGSYGVWFTSSPISGLSETKFNLKVDAVSTKNTGATNSKEYLHTLETKLGRRFTRYLYKASDELGYKSTAFVEQGNIIVSNSIPIVEEGREWISKDTITKYTKLSNTFIEL